MREKRYPLTIDVQLRGYYEPKELLKSFSLPISDCYRPRSEELGFAKAMSFISGNESSPIKVTPENFDPNLLKRAFAKALEAFEDEILKINKEAKNA
jgi:hypothetical protein